MNATTPQMSPLVNSLCCFSITSQLWATAEKFNGGLGTSALQGHWVRPLPKLCTGAQDRPRDRMVGDDSGPGTRDQVLRTWPCGQADLHSRSEPARGESRWKGKNNRKICRPHHGLGLGITWKVTAKELNLHPRLWIWVGWRGGKLMHPPYFSRIVRWDIPLHHREMQPKA